MLLTGVLIGSCWVHSLGQTPGFVKQWDKTYGGDRADELHTLIPTQDGGYLAGGQSTSNAFGTRTQGSQGRTDYWLLKLDAQGMPQWDQRYGGDGYDEAWALLQTSDGGYLIGGDSRKESMGGDKTQLGFGDYDFWVIKTSPTGVKQWDVTLGTGSPEHLTNLVETQDGGYLLAGESDNAYGVWKLSANGQTNWIRTYRAGSGLRWPATKLQTVQPTADGGFLLAGSATGGVFNDRTQPDRGGYDYWIVKIGALGQKEWDWAYGGPGDDELRSCQPTPDGGYLLGGTTSSGIGGDKTQTSRGKKDLWLVKIDAAGTLQWERRFGGQEDDIMGATRVIPGGYLVGASSWSPVSGDKTQPCWGYDDYWLLQLDLQGRLVREQRYGSTSLDALEALVLTRDGGCLLGGWSYSFRYGDKSEDNIGQVNFWLVKMAPFLPLSTLKPTLTGEVRVAPNPAHDQLHFTIPAQPTMRVVTVVLLDAVGRQVKQEQYTGNLAATSATLPVRGLPAGVYYLRLEAPNQLIGMQRVLVQ
ncbi:T9SS type A sorting domain-containing protein [Hymenobacter rigui]|uniref:T9SS type A sorting domain-containing protein n=1 Tax=Hymenobacter rigui TaxID=334424 RepID=UPI001476D441|nr:T9SS type A sorting domain-containing protein [Hymenobacter rigui]